MKWLWNILEAFLGYQITTEFAFICLRILEANFFVILFTSYRKKYANFIHYVIEALPKISQGVTVTNALCPPGLTN